MARFRKYFVEESFFNTWSHEMAYILGFITADGSVSKYSLRLEVKLRDIEVLNFIKSKLCPTAKITTTIKKGKKYRRLSINSILLVESLNIFNIIQSKSKTIRANFDIPEKYIGDYLRGVFDGDGWIHLRRNTIETGICSGSKNFLVDLQFKISSERIFKRIRRRVKINKSGEKCYCWSWDLSKKASIFLRDLMYQNECFSLKRKKNLFFSEFYKPSSRLWTKDQIDYLVFNFKPNTIGCLDFIGDKLNKSKKAVSKKALMLGLTTT